MSTRHFVSMMFSGGMILAAGVACGQSFPVKPVRIVTAAKMKYDMARLGKMIRDLGLRAE